MPNKRRTLVYFSALLGAALLTVVGGWLLTPAINEPYQDEINTTASNPVQVHALFRQGLTQMLANEYEKASATWSSVLTLKPDFPEAHVNQGFTLMELEQPQRACEHFDMATRLNNYQLNAYYGLAICLEALGDIPGALGSMRSFVHLSPEDDPFMRKANAAIWEWQAIIDARGKDDNQVNSTTKAEN